MGSKMANRWFNQFSFSLVKAKVFLFGKVAIGASGAPTISTANSKGITSITRNSAGKYTLVLQDQYAAFLNVHASVLLASGLPAVLGYAVVSEAVASTAKTIVIQFLDAAGAAADPDSGAVLYFTIILNNSSAI